MLSSIENDNSIIINGTANQMAQTLSSESNYHFMPADQASAEENANNGGLSIVTYENPNGHGHVATFTVGTNQQVGPVSNIGPRAYSGFVPLNRAIGASKPKSYFVYLPNSLSPATIRQ
ncbi:MAG: hypothetical protein AUJ98_09065 [Bacteroidetes bacterium CG2_30_33_31]|nr:MAG: hypothetical protein AUJ98_09065 [Bacteroidetes bacterium CG2_30_33_31]